jgi:hypothetical protein
LVAACAACDNKSRVLTVTAADVGATSDGGKPRDGGVQDAAEPDAPAAEGGAPRAHGACRGLDSDPARREASCTGIERLRLRNAKVVSAGLDGALVSGEKAVVTVQVVNEGEDYFNAPCVGLAVDARVVVRSANPAYGPCPYTLLPGETCQHQFDVDLAGRLPAGSVVTFTAYTATAGADCTSGDNLSFTATVT